MTRYRGVAPTGLKEILDTADALAEAVHPDWQFDPKTGGFYVIVNKKRFDIAFETEEDPETRLVRFASKHLPTLAGAARGRYHFFD